MLSKQYMSLYQVMPLYYVAYVAMSELASNSKFYNISNFFFTDLST